MNWTAEDTEILQLMNRVRQLMNKRSPTKYAKFATAGTGTFTCKIEMFSFYLSESQLLVHAHRDQKAPVRVFKCELGPGRPSYVGDLDYIRKCVTPAIDREMVLDDLSRLGNG